MSIVHVRDLTRLLADGLVPVHPTEVQVALADLEGAKLELSALVHHQALWVTRVSEGGAVEVCSVHTYCEVTAPHEPFVWRLFGFAEGVGRVDVCVALVPAVEGLREASSRQLYRDLFADRATATSLLALDLSAKGVPALVRDVMARSLQLVT
jgi:hypothetical protein